MLLYRENPLREQPTALEYIAIELCGVVRQLYKLTVEIVSGTP